MKTRIVCALLLALMLLALAGCGKKEDHPQPEDPNVTQEEEAVPVHLVCSNGSITLRFSLEEGHWLWADDKTFPLDESYALALLETVQGIESGQRCHLLRIVLEDDQFLQRFVQKNAVTFHFLRRQVLFPFRAKSVQLHLLGSVHRRPP